jgi:hypothetical protein
MVTKPKVPTPVKKDQPYQRTFDKIELLKIKELSQHMNNAVDVTSWNSLRQGAKDIWDEKIISAVDGLRKWLPNGRVKIQ